MSTLRCSQTRRHLLIFVLVAVGASGPLEDAAGAQGDERTRQRASTTPTTVSQTPLPGSPPTSVPGEKRIDFDTTGPCINRPGAAKPLAADSLPQVAARATAALAAVPDAHKNDVPRSVKASRPRGMQPALPTRATDPLVISDPSTVDSFGVTLRGGRAQPLVVLDDETTVHPDAFDETDVMLQISSVNAARTALLLRGPNAPTEFRFDFTPLCVGSSRQSLSTIRLEMTDRGAVRVVLATGPETHGLGMIGAPWAVDAAGMSLPTSYEVQGSTLIQRVDTAGAIFPVVADPTYYPRPCNGYVSDANAWGYILSGACPVPAIFNSIRSYDGVWAYEANVYNDYGYVVVRQDGGCTAGPDTGPSWDFQLPSQGARLLL